MMLENTNLKLIILDRDGVINYDSPDYIKKPEEWQAIPGSLLAIARLNQHGYRVAVATNQSGLARGLITLDSLTAIHQKMQQQVTAVGGCIDTVFFCPHGPSDGCDCRKPQPGLLQQIARHYHIELKGVPLVGDSLRDIQAAEAMGCQPILVKTGHGLKTLQQLSTSLPVFENLAEVVDNLLSNF